MLCAARVQIGPLRQSFWALWDREERRRYARTRMRPGGEVTMDGAEVRVDAPSVAARLRFGEGAPIEAVCPSGERGYGWTRKRAGVPVSGTIEAGGRRWQVDARGRRRRVGRLPPAPHELALVGGGRAGRRRPGRWPGTWSRGSTTRRSAASARSGSTARRTSRQPVSFSGLDAVEFADGARLRLRRPSPSGRATTTCCFRSRYRHRFGTFPGSLDGIELDRRASA